LGKELRKRPTLVENCCCGGCGGCFVFGGVWGVLGGVGFCGCFGVGVWFGGVCFPPTKQNTKRGFFFFGCCLWVGFFFFLCFLFWGKDLARGPSPFPKKRKDRCAEKLVFQKKGLASEEKKSVSRGKKESRKKWTLFLRGRRREKRRKLGGGF